MLEAGFITFFSFLFLAAKIPPKYLLRILGRPLIADLTVTIFLFILYRGTGSGLAAATFAALIFSLTISVARRCMGWVDGKTYQVGWFYRPDLTILFDEKDLTNVKVNDPQNPG